MLHKWEAYWRCHALQPSANYLYVVKLGHQKPLDFVLFGVFSYGPVTLANEPFKATALRPHNETNIA